MIVAEENDTDQLSEPQIEMVKLARHKGVCHTKYRHSDSDRRIPFGSYPTSHSAPCVACKQPFHGPPIFVPLSHSRETDLWVLDPFPCCSRPACGKYHLVKTSGVTFAARCTLFKEYLAKFFSYYKPVPYIDVQLPEQLRQTSGDLVAVSVQYPPFTFVNTWISESDIEKSDQRKHSDFYQRNTLKATKQQQSSYDSKIDMYRTAFSKKPGTSSST